MRSQQKKDRNFRLLFTTIFYPIVAIKEKKKQRIVFWAMASPPLVAPNSFFVNIYFFFVELLPEIGINYLLIRRNGRGFSPRLFLYIFLHQNTTEESTANIIFFHYIRSEKIFLNIEKGLHIIPPSPLYASTCPSLVVWIDALSFPLCVFSTKICHDTIRVLPPVFVRLYLERE